MASDLIQDGLEARDVQGLSHGSGTICIPWVALRVWILRTLACKPEYFRQPNLSDLIGMYHVYIYIYMYVCVYV